MELQFYDPQPHPELPPKWTGDHVIKRMVEAMEFLARCRGHVGPRGVGSGMPAYVHNAFDKAGYWQAGQNPDGSPETEMQTKERIRVDTDLESKRIVVPPSARELEFMDEAMNWPWKYLGWDNGPAVSIVRWAWLIASGKDSGGELVKAATSEAETIAYRLNRAKIVVR